MPLDNNKNPTSPKHSRAVPRYVDEIDGGYPVPGSPLSPRSLGKPARKTSPTTKDSMSVAAAQLTIADVGQSSTVHLHSAFQNDDSDGHLVTHPPRYAPIGLHPTAQNNDAVLSQNVARQTYHRHRRESFQYSHSMQPTDYNYSQLGFQSLSGLFDASFSQPQSYLNSRFSDNEFSPEDIRYRLTVINVENQYMLGIKAAPTEMAVHSTPSSSDKPGHDPPEGILSAEGIVSTSASHLSQRDILQSRQSRRDAHLSPPLYLTDPLTELDDLRPFSDGQRERYLGIDGPDVGSANRESASGRSSGIDIQTQGVPQHIPVTEAANESPIDKTFLDCLVRLANPGPLPGLDRIRETVKAAISQKYETDPQLNRYLLQVDVIITRFKPSVGSDAIRTDRNKVKKHDTTHSCPVSGCTGGFTRKNGLKNHLGAHFVLATAICPTCSKGFSASSIKRHITNCKGKQRGR
ncbi:hypothetical protein HYPSUDRAFT_52522 [Hypholoma sublateritium FD-334 SS-4]|uniref:C2H2-type domain-containing protein n=1 Tax=Hypholoma sublateritium (strain FD-334 SS-4) TaxID=945553 RepID=A0A0D2MQE7_HYPSF|nr:hypothetical protein HYPSUDRAFT_52522 [Hypholoma sublateritium FD-334 SS-4]